MAGAIVISPDEIWSASNSQFRWLLDYLLEKISEADLGDRDEYLRVLALRLLEFKVGAGTDPRT